MPKKTSDIPVNILPEGTCRGIMLMREAFDGSPNSEQVERAHRDGGYTFIIQEAGKTELEIDFQRYVLEAPALIFIHPQQVHRVIAFEEASISTWIITEENVRPEYLSLLQELAPADRLPLTSGTLTLLTDSVALCMKLSEQKTEKLYNSILKESVNTLVALIVSQYLALARPAEQHSRYEEITKGFKNALEKHFKTVKDPAAYAAQLHISTSYLNECVKSTTGRPVSDHIQLRVVLEAKRLLYHSGKSVKEIAGELGYADFSYFTRLFRKVTGLTPVAFREHNRE